ncbi:acetate kinase [Rhodobacter sp. Har01]|uniref:acetate/propionate family kinase n=1 Tax=Rhodobacter sp. Har01 TaxID=2883999 RepID=UPI001D074691|nr:acetate kinase [Rhodobacter sp. Har01]MCB6176790.1 acetate kinase [Rhodobacter sp. Har01]
MWLVVNTGSSSVKLVAFDADLAEAARVMIDRIGTGGPADHAAAMAEGLGRMGLSAGSLVAAAHRVVHGGARYTAPQRVTAEVLAGIEACVPLAPLHNPGNLTGIRAVSALVPDLPQYASFDTAFHASQAPEAVTYSLPAAERARGLRRYGFHGLSYAAIVRIMQGMFDNSQFERLLVFHLGNGVSACAIRSGRSVATTMGWSPTDGLTMGTRSGSIDPMAVLDLAERHGIDGARRILNRESGLLGLGGHSDMRALQAAGTREAAFAVDHFCHWAIRHAGSLIAAMEGLDAIVFTGGIGENDATIRARILDGLSWTGAVCRPEANRHNARMLHETHSHVMICIVPADEERQIALEARAVRESEA